MIALIIVVILVAIVGFVIATYNELVQLRNKVKNSFAQIDTQLQRRFDLIPNLVETVQGFASHEKELLENVTASRSGYMNAGTNQEKLAMNNQLTAGLRSLFAVAENYPELKSNTNFLNMQEELSETEDGYGRIPLYFYSPPEHLIFFQFTNLKHSLYLFLENKQALRKDKMDENKYA